MSTLVYLFAAYTVLWILIFAYAFRLSRRQRALEEEAKALGEASLKGSEEER